MTHHIISLGAGLQSTTMLLMACHAELTPKPSAAIFADTGWEREQTYKTVDFLTAYAANYDIPVITVQAGNIREESLHPEALQASPSAFHRRRRHATEAMHL